MGIYKSDITDLRKNIKENIGQKIIVKESPGKRSKPTETEAVIGGVYQSYFNVSWKKGETQQLRSYNYTDLLTRSVEISMYNGESYEPLVQPQLEIKKTRIQHEVVENS